MNQQLVVNKGVITGKMGKGDWIERKDESSQDAGISILDKIRDHEIAGQKRKNKCGEIEKIDGENEVFCNAVDRRKEKRGNEEMLRISKRKWPWKELVGVKVSIYMKNSSRGNCKPVVPHDPGIDRKVAKIMAKSGELRYERPCQQSGEEETQKKDKAEFAYFIAMRASRTASPFRGRRT